ncbi:MAG: 50S ribosomal protein L29 [Alphaproteobacteria bacterium]
MAKKEVKLSALNAKELNEKLISLKQEEFNLRIQHSTGSLTNTASIRKNRKEIARVNTALASANKEENK